MMSAPPALDLREARGFPVLFRKSIGRLLSGLLGTILRLPPASLVYNARAQDTDAPDDLRQRLAQVEAELASKTRSIALTSHELRTPLNGILGMADLLTRTPLSAEQASYVQAVNTSATALLSLVDDMLNAGKIAAGHLSPKLQPVAIEALVEEVIELLAPRAQAKGLELAAHVTAQVPESVSADPDQLMRILTNLTGNAIKFTDHGGVAIDVSVEHQTGERVTLALRVRDSGIGISPSDQARIFDEYEQADAGARPRPNGTGLGLAISRTAARAMGGDITLESTLGKGSVFCFQVDLPILRVSASVQRPLVGRHMLLISNKTIEPPVLMRRLFDMGASVELARTLEAARSSLATNTQVDAILFDHSEDLDAVEFKRSLTGEHPPIAVIIAPADRHALGRIKDNGIKAYLVKPMRTGSLIKVISAMISGETVAMQAIEPPVPTKSPDANDTSEAVDTTILLVDDNDINLLLGQSVLRSLGHASDVVKDGKLAVARATDAIRLGRPYDVILMDLHMPELDGFAAMTAIRREEKAAGHRSLIIALTADITEQTSLRAIEAGADLAMTKPIRKQLLLDALEKRQLVGSATHGDAQKRREPAI